MAFPSGNLHAKKKQQPEVNIVLVHTNPRKRALIWCTQVVQNLVELIDIVTALEERLSTKKLSKDTADGPDINYNHISNLAKAKTKRTRRNPRVRDSRPRPHKIGAVFRSHVLALV